MIGKCADSFIWLVVELFSLLKRISTSRQWHVAPTQVSMPHFYKTRPFPNHKHWISLMFKPYQDEKKVSIIIMMVDQVVGNRWALNLENRSRFSTDDRHWFHIWNQGAVFLDVCVILPSFEELCQVVKPRKMTERSDLVSVASRRFTKGSGEIEDSGAIWSDVFCSSWVY